MHEMKFDMSGGAAVLEATAAIARLGLPVRLMTVIGATENLPCGPAIKPGDIVTARTGTTIEVINTDAEGRLVLADCLAYAIEQGAERLVDVATLTGAIVSALGSTIAGLLTTTTSGPSRCRAAGERAGELTWRLPFHEDYGELIKGRYADIANALENRKARLDHGRRVPAPLRRRRAVGARRHRRDRLRRPRPALRRQGRLGLRRAAAGRAGARERRGADLH